jgi:hypothetical protein
VLLKIVLLLVAFLVPGVAAAQADPFDAARGNGAAAAEALERCDRFVRGWLALADPVSGLIPRNTTDLAWVPKDSAADNYPFMVLTTALTDRRLFETRMLEMLRAEERLSSRVGRLRDEFDFATRSFRHPQPDTERLMFGTAEYIKDGLLPLTEYLGPSPWSEQMILMLDDMWARAGVQTPFGDITSTNLEVQGDQLQSLVRVYWITGDRQYLDWAIRLGDLYLLGDRHPTRHLRELRLRDHGCEIVGGLVELYATLHFVDPAKKQQYREPVHAMLDRILEVGRNEHGLFFDAIDPVAGKPTAAGISDNWGYTLNAHYTVHLLDDVPAYRDAVRQALSHLNEHYRNYQWENGTADLADGHADAIESALNLYNREPVASAAEWIDDDVRVLWSKQQPSGVIEGWHGDGNFARTSIMYALWKSQGLTAHPWRRDLQVGAVRQGDSLYVTLRADEPWTGTLRFDVPRHRVHMKLPIDYPRINQFPEWFTVEADSGYAVQSFDPLESQEHTGASLARGLAISVPAGGERRLVITPRR